MESPLDDNGKNCIMGADSRKRGVVCGAGECWTELQDYDFAPLILDVCAAGLSFITTTIIMNDASACYFIRCFHI
jgi:hypothetical protein